MLAGSTVCKIISEKEQRKGKNTILIALFTFQHLRTSSKTEKANPETPSASCHCRSVLGMTGFLLWDRQGVAETHSHKEAGSLRVEYG